MLQIFLHSKPRLKPWSLSWFISDHSEKYGDMAAPSNYHYGVTVFHLIPELFNDRFLIDHTD
jgi:hypothetical protein